MNLFYFSDSQKVLKYKGRYKITYIDKLENINDEFHLGIFCLSDEKKMINIINELEKRIDIPYIVITDTLNKKNFYSISQVGIINSSEINKIDSIILEYFKKKSDISIFNLVDIMQMLYMDKKSIAIKVTNNDSIGVIVFKEGRPIYSKLSINDETLRGKEAAFRIISWEKPIFKLANLSIEVINNLRKNLNTNLMNLLMEAMQYKDEKDMAEIEKEELLEEEFGSFKIENNFDIVHDISSLENNAFVFSDSNDSIFKTEETNMDVDEDTIVFEEIEEEKKENKSFDSLKDDVYSIFKNFDKLIDISVFKNNNIIISNKGFEPKLGILLESIIYIVEKIKLGLLERVILNSDIIMILEYQKESNTIILIRLKKDANITMAKILSTKVKELVISQFI